MAKTITITATDDVVEQIRQMMKARVDNCSSAADAANLHVDALQADLQAAKERRTLARAALKDAKDAYDSAFPSPPQNP